MPFGFIYTIFDTNPSSPATIKLSHFLKKLIFPATIITVSKSNHYIYSAKLLWLLKWHKTFWRTLKLGHRASYRKSRRIIVSKVYLSYKYFFFLHHLTFSPWHNLIELMQILVLQGNNPLGQYELWKVTSFGVICRQKEWLPFIFQVEKVYFFPVHEIQKCPE